MLVVFQHFLLLPTAFGLGIGVVLGHPGIGLTVGLVVGTIYAGFMALILRRALAEGTPLCRHPADGGNGTMTTTGTLDPSRATISRGDR